MPRRLLALASLFALAASPVAAEPPKLNYLIPSGIAPGEATEVKLYGAELGKAAALWSNLPGLIATPVVKDSKTKAGSAAAAASDLFRLTVPADTPLGIYALRAATPEGITNLRLFAVDDLPTVRDNNANKTPATAQELTLPVAVEGGCEAESYDYYKFHAVQGQRVSVEILARRLGSVLDPVIRLLDSSGRELAYSDDDDATGADGRFSHQVAATGDYFLEVRDIRYAGGAGHRYRLRLGDFPLASVPYPLAAPQGTTVKVVVTGPDVAGLPPLEVRTSAAEAGSRVPFAARLPHGQGSGLVALAVSQGIEQVEFEPNDTLEAASPIELAGAVNGRFDKPHDRDFFKFDVKKGQRFVFTGRTRSLGAPTDLFLRLYDAAGNKVAEADDSGTDEGAIDYTFPADGVYRLMAEDLLTRGGPDRVYRIEIEPYRPGFTLALDADTLNAPRGGVATAKLTCVRRDYKGPIRLELQGAADGVRLLRDTLGEDKNDLIVTVAVPPRLPQGTWQSLALVGKAKIGDAEFVAAASTTAALRASLGGLANPPAELDGALALGVGPVFPDFFQLAADTKDRPAVVPFPQLLGTTSFKVKATKLNKFDDKITLSVEGLPAPFAAKAAAIDKGKAEAVIEIAGPRALAEGEYPIRVVGSATFQSQDKKVVLEDLLLRVVKPLSVTLTPAGKLPAGGKQKVKIHVAFAGDAKGAVKLGFLGLPKGVAAPKELTLAEGKYEIEAELAADVGLAPGPIDLVAVATTRIKDQEIVVESPAATLDVSRN